MVSAVVATVVSLVICVIIALFVLAYTKRRERAAVEPSPALEFTNPAYRGSQPDDSYADVSPFSLGRTVVNPVYDNMVA